MKSVLVKPMTAQELSGYFCSFKQSEQIVVYKAAVKNFDILTEGILLHLYGLAEGTIFETYDLGRLGRWVGYCFPFNSLVIKEKLEVDLHNKTASSYKKRIITAFIDGFESGRTEGILNASQTANTKEIKSISVQPSKFKDPNFLAGSFQ